MFTRRPKVVVAVAMTALAVVSMAQLASAKSMPGKSSTESPYVVSSIPGVNIRSILTVGDSVNRGPNGTPYRMVGIPDGLGAFDNGDGTFTLLMNHELNATAGIERAHGAKGAFISKWVISKGDLRVLHGEDLIKWVVTWNKETSSWNAPATGIALARLCSADLADISAFYDFASGRGYHGRLFLSGEESGAEGRAFAHAMDGTTYELPWMGKASWENLVANPSVGQKTVVAGLDDSGGGQVYFYVGEKRKSGNPVEKAGLANGTLYGVKIEGIEKETDATTLAGPTNFTLAPLGNVADWTGAKLEEESTKLGISALNRPEDGAWDPNNPNDFYFVTTANMSGKSRLYRLRFEDAANPQLGGTAEMLLDGTEGPKMMDNLTVTKRGQILIQEDPGNNPHLAKIWNYSIATGALSLVAEHDPDRFAPGGSDFVTQDEESSGMIDVSDILGEGNYLFVVQAHYKHSDAELVEGGQLLQMHIPAGKKLERVK